MHVHTCMHTHMCMHTCTHIHACVHTYMHAHTYVHAHMHTCVCAHMCRHTYTCVHAHMYAHTYMQAYMHTCVRAHTHMHAHTHARAHTCFLMLAIQTTCSGTVFPPRQDAQFTPSPTIGACPRNPGLHSSAPRRMFSTTEQSCETLFFSFFPKKKGFKLRILWLALL